MLQVHVHPAGTAMYDALRRELRALQADDPVRPVTVAVPSNYAGLALRRALARPAEGDPGGLLNVRFLVMPRVLELLGAPLLAARGQRPLTRAIEVELIRSALVEDPGVFRDIASHPSTEQRVAASFRDLADLAPGERADLAAAPGTAGDAVRIFERVQALADGRYYDDRALANAAAEAARTHHAALADLGALVVFQPGPLTVAERAFIDALAEQQDVTVLLAATGDPFADDPVFEQWDQSVPAGIEVPEATHLVSAPDAEEEVRHAIRMTIAALERGTPPHRIAILSRHAAPYAALLASQLQAAEVPWSGVRPETLAQTVTGRALLGVMALPEQQFSRRAVAAWLAGAPVLLGPQGGRLVPAHRWDALARQAGIVAGAEGWRDRLAAYEGQLTRDLESARNDEEHEWRIAAIERDLEEVRALRAFIDELFALLEPPPSPGWAALVEWGQRLLLRYVGTEASFGMRLPADIDAEHELEAYRSIADALGGLAVLEDVRGGIDVKTFQRTLLQELNRPARRVSRFGEGVFVGRLAHAVGGDFDHVFILGMNEGAIPTKGSDDPLLPEHAWEAVSGGVPSTRRSRRTRVRAEERRTYLAALASAPTRTLIAARADLRETQGRLRSRWLLDSAKTLAGRRLTNDDLDEVNAPWHTIVPSFEGALASEVPAVSLSEHDLRSLRAWREARRRIEDHPLALAQPLLAAGWDAQRGRRSRIFTRWDGNTGRLPDSLLHDVTTRAHSPTSLQNWAECPHRYLFGALLRIADREEPEEQLRMTALDRGSLIHAVLERFMNERRPTDPDARWTDADRTRLLEILDDECEQAEAAGTTGARALWRLDRAALDREMLLFLEMDEEYRRKHGVIPVASELAFGDTGDVAVDLDNGRRVHLRGRIDRVDRSPDGRRAVVVDYKSGSAYRMDRIAKDRVDAGRRLQLPVYAAAVDSLYHPGEIESYYWFTRPDVAEFHGYAIGPQSTNRFHEALTRILDGIEQGIFPSVSGEWNDRDQLFANCRFCAYDAICSRDRTRELERKEQTDEVQRYRALTKDGNGYNEVGA